LQSTKVRSREIETSNDDQARLEGMDRGSPNAHGGCAHPIDVAKYIWVNYQDELQGAGDLFYTWQHEVQWAIDDLQREGRLLPKSKTKGHKGPWRLA
jgi:hypothetical protein